MNEPRLHKPALTAMEMVEVNALSHALLEALPIGICAVDLDGRIVSLNMEGSRLLGWSERSCRGHVLHDLIRCNTPLDNEQTICPIASVLYT
ncbi:MAG: PAS domain-containing protein, partial [Nitrospiraceae bacterium]